MKRDLSFDNIATGLLIFCILASLLLCFSPINAQKKAPALPNYSAQSDTALANQYFRKASSLSKSAKFDSSNFYYENAREIYFTASEQNNSVMIWEKIVKCYNNTGSNLWKQGKYKEAMTNLNHALQLGLEKLGSNHLEIANSYNRMGIIHTIQGNYDKGLEFFEKALLASGEKHPRFSAKTYNNIGIIHVERGEYDQALESYQKSLGLRIAHLGENHSQVGASYNNIGNVYWYKSDYDKALEYYHKDLSIQRKLYREQHPKIAESYHNIGMVHSQKGDYDQAVELWQKALSIRRQTLGEEHPLVASTYFNLGRCYLSKGELAQALEYGQQALAIRIATFGETHPDVAQTYNHLANVYYKQAALDEAFTYLKKALAVRLEIFGSFHPDVAQTYYDMAQIYSAREKYEIVLAHCQKAMTSLVSGFEDTSVYRNPELQKISDERLLLQVLALKGATLARLDGMNDQNLQRALSTFKVAADLIDRIRTGYKAEGSKFFLGETTAEIYGQGVETSLTLFDLTKEEQYREEAFRFAEKSKAAVLQEGLAEADARLYASLPADLLERERLLRRELTFIETRLQKELASKSRRDSVKIREYQGRLFDLNTQYENLISNLEENYPAYHDLKYQTEPVAVPELQTHLGSKKALLEYFVGHENIYAYVVTEDEFDVIAIRKDSTFTQQVDDFYQAVVKGESKKYVTTTVDLTNQLIKPVMSKLRTKQEWVIIPHDLLYKIPFEALFTESSPSAGRIDFGDLPYLVKEVAISYHHSATLYRNTFQPLRTEAEQNRIDFVGFAPVFAEDDATGYTLASKDFTGVSNDPIRSVMVDGKRFDELKYSEEEVHSIVELFSKKGRDKTGVGFFHASATEAAFKAEAGKYRAVHIATHSFINEERPQLSGVVFAQPAGDTAPEDGILYAGETYNLDLNADLVVLSSCESGLGKLVRGEGMMALTRGFLYSGADNVIFSLWKVPDKHTSALMINFYEQVLSGRSYSESLRQAKLEAIANPGTARPRSWASFVLIGAE